MVGISETALYAGPYRPFEWYYLNPLIIFYGENQNQPSSGGSDNDFLAFDWRVRPFPKTEVYGEFLVDDYQIDKKVPSDLKPAQAAGVIGVRQVDPCGVDGLDLGVAYVQVRSRTVNPSPRIPIWSVPLRISASGAACRISMG